MEQPRRPEGPLPEAQPGLSTLIERGLALTLFAGLMLGILATLRPFATAILFGSILVIATWPLRRLLLRTGLPRAGAATLLLLLALALVVLPLLALAPSLVEGVQAGLVLARQTIENAPTAPPRWLAELPVIGSQAEQIWARAARQGGDVATLLAPYAEQIRARLLDLAAALLDSTMQLLLSLVVAAALWVTGDRLAAVLEDAAGRIGGATAIRSLDAAAAAVRAVAYGVVGTAFLQGILQAIGLAIAGVPGAGLLGLLTLVFSISQILGPLVVATWIGAAWWLWNQGDTFWAVFMALWGAVAVSSSDNVIRPLLISRGTEMPLSIIILGVFGGFVSFGFLGLFIGPTLLAVGFVLLQAWRRNAVPPSHL